MAKKSKVEAYTDVKELNWEDAGIEGVPACWGVLEKLAEHLEKVDPEVRTDNPVRHWALCDDHCTFVFRDGRKVVVTF